MVVTATQRLKKLEVDLNTFQIGQNDTFSTQNYKIDIQEHKTNMVYEINGANNLYNNNITISMTTKLKLILILN